MSLEHMDPFATSSSLGPDEEDPERITGGRYRLPDLVLSPDLEGGTALHTSPDPRKGGWQRVTTLVKSIGDARALDLWHQRELIRGLVLRPDLYDLACATLSTETDPAALRRELESLASKVLMAAGADAGANTGTAFHGFTEAQDLGLMHYARRKWHGKLSNYQAGLTAHKLQVIPELVERRVVILKYGAAGTLDRILHDLTDDVLRIGDLKSQKAFWTWIEISAQLAAYGMGDAMWDRKARAYTDMPKVATDKAIVAWMPVDHPDGEWGGGSDGVDFFDVDLEQGRDFLDLCYRVDRARSSGRSKHQTIGLLRPVPELSRVEAYARRLDAVASLSEGSALWREIWAVGLADTPELLELAEEVAGRFAATP